MLKIKCNFFYLCVDVSIEASNVDQVSEADKSIMLEGRDAMAANNTGSESAASISREGSAIMTETKKSYSRDDNTPQGIAF